MTGSVVERLVPDPLAGNLSEIEREHLEARRVGAAAAVAFGSGALMVSEDSVLTLGDGSTEENQKQQLGLRMGGGGKGRNTPRVQVPRGGCAVGKLAGLLAIAHHSLPTLPSPQLAMFALQLGVLSTFLSEPVVKALTSGAALHVLVSQLPSLLGLSLPRQIGCFSLFKVGVEKESRGKGQLERGGVEGGKTACSRKRVSGTTVLREGAGEKSCLGLAGWC